MEYSENIKVALQGLRDHKFRSFLTMLGIIFGVASVITMLSIGEGAKREAIAKYQDLGVNNIIIREKDMTEEELEEALKAIISRLGATTPQQMGMVMGTATKELAGRAEGKAISAKVKELLSK